LFSDLEFMFKILDLWIDLSSAEKSQLRGLSMGDPPSNKNRGFYCEVSKDLFYRLNVFDESKILVVSLCLNEEQFTQLVINAEICNR